MKAESANAAATAAPGAVIGGKPEAEAKPTRPIKSSDFGILDYNCNKWWAVIDLDDYERAKTDAKMWLNVSAKLSIYDIVEVRTRGGEQTADWVVAENHGQAGGFIRLPGKSKTILNEKGFEAARATGEWHVALQGPRRWVLISPEGRIVRDGMLSREAAEYEMRARRGDLAAPRQPIL